MIGLPSPWLILAAALAIGAAGIAGYSKGERFGADKIQVQWDKDEAARALKASENVQRGRDTEEKLQLSADEQRTKDAKTFDDLNRSLADATDRLSKRPARAGLADSGAALAQPRAEGWCTGAGLYRDDGLFLRRQADLWQRVRVQRDACYTQYEEAQVQIEALKKAKDNSPSSPPP